MQKKYPLLQKSTLIYLIRYQESTGPVETYMDIPFSLLYLKQPTKPVKKRCDINKVV